MLKSKQLEFGIRFFLPVLIIGILPCFFQFLNKYFQTSIEFFTSLAIQVFLILLAFIYISIIIKPFSSLLIIAKKLIAFQGITGSNRDSINITAANLEECLKKTQKIIRDISENTSVFIESSKEIMLSADQMAATSVQVEAAIVDLAKGATQQAISTEEGSGYIAEIVGGLTQITSDMKNSEELAEKALIAVDIVQQSVSIQDTKMKETALASAQVSQAISELSVNSNEIDQIIMVIKTISDQTNLLALNAAIEAARAGEHGKGFAVVAEEIQKLSEQSSQSVNRISSIINDVQNGIDKAVVNIKKSENSSIEHSAASVRAKEAFKDTYTIVEAMADNVKTVYYSTEVLCDSAKQVDTIIKDISGISQEFAAGTEEVCASSEEQVAASKLISECMHDLVDTASTIQSETADFRL